MDLIFNKKVLSLYLQKEIEIIVQIRVHFQYYDQKENNNAYDSNFSNLIHLGIPQIRESTNITTKTSRYML